MARVLKNEAGYSLIEVMVSILILTAAIIPMVSMFDTGLRTAVLGGNYDGARALANQKMEEVKALPYSRPGAPMDSAVEKFPPGTPVSGTSGIYTWTVQTTYVSETFSTPTAERGRMRVVTRVTWDSGSKSIATTGVVTGYEL